MNVFRILHQIFNENLKYLRQKKTLRIIFLIARHINVFFLE